MSRIYWDTMLFIYLLEDHAVYAPRVRQLLERAYKRRDALYTSYLALGEIMAGAEKSPQPQKSLEIYEAIREMGFSFLPFDGGAVAPFSRLRSKEKTENRGLDPSCLCGIGRHRPVFDRRQATIEDGHPRHSIYRRFRYADSLNFCLCGGEP